MLLMIRANAGGSVDLRHAGSNKLATTSTGIDVTGTVTSDDTVISGSNPTLTIYETDTTNLNTRFDNGGGDLYIQTVNDDGSNAKTRMLIDHATGDINLGYEDTGTTAKLFWDASAESLGIGTTNPNRELEIASSSPDIRLTDIEGGYSEVSGSGGQFTFKADPGNTQGGSRIAFEIDGSEKVRYNTTGVGIGTTNPTSKLHVQGDIEFLSGHKLSQDTNDNLEIRTGSSATQKGIHLRAGFGDAGNSTGVFKLYTGGQSTERLTVNADGEVTIAQDTTVNGKFVIESQSPSIELIDTNNNSDFELNNSNGVFQIFDKTVDTSRFNITSSGNVGIGTTSPATPLHISNTYPVIRLTDSDGTAPYAQIINSSGLLQLRADDNNSTANSAIQFFVDGGGEKARIDLSGNLLVNQTAIGDYTNTAGSSFRATGFSTHTRDGGDVLLLNRLTSDGNILLFRKDNSTVGSIGTKSGDLNIGTGDVGLHFWDGGDSIYAWNTSTNSGRDAAVDLGYSGVRFKDLHLSGTANFGSLITHQQEYQNHLVT